MTHPNPPHPSAGRRARSRCGTSVLTGLIFFAGCAQGIDPPAPTPIIELAAGSFSMGDPAVDPCDEMRVGRNGPVMPGRLSEQSARVVHRVDVGRFCLDAREVTVEQYGHCEARGQCAAPEATNAGNQGEVGFIAQYYGRDTGYGQHPALGVSWRQAAAYCAFREGRLPSEAEWAFAARSRGARDTIWVDEAVAELIDGGCEASSFAGTVALGACATGSRAVGTSTQDVTLEGVHDMAGNAAEWVADEFDFLGYCALEQGNQPVAELFDVEGGLFVPRIGETLLSDAGCLAVDPATARYAGEAVDLFRACKESCRAGFANALEATAQGEKWRQHACATVADLALEEVNGADFPSCGGDPCEGRPGCPEFCACLGMVMAPEDGGHCLRRCVTDFEVVARPCVREGVAFACVPLDQNANCEPVPWCLPRSSVAPPHVAPAANVPVGLRGAHVVRGGHFQSATGCEGRPAARRGALTSSAVIGFRCAYDAETPRCP